MHRFDQSHFFVVEAAAGPFNKSSVPATLLTVARRYVTEAVVVCVVAAKVCVLSGGVRLRQIAVAEHWALTIAC